VSNFQSFPEKEDHRITEKPQMGKNTKTKEEKRKNLQIIGKEYGENLQIVIFNLTIICHS